MITTLQTGVCLIKFEKVDGTKRIMYATLHPSAIPEEKTEKETGKSLSTSVVRVFDIEKFEWRSYRVDSVELFEKISNDMSIAALETIIEHGGTCV